VYGPLADNPGAVGKPLRFELSGLYSVRRGDHRIVYRIDGAPRRVIVEVIEHRRRVYRPR
jgi:mRNA interferase RelE/StbE